MFVFEIQTVMDFSDKFHVLISNADSTGKFSRHIIIRIPKVAFKSNFHVGGFVSEVRNYAVFHSIIENVHCS